MLRARKLVRTLRQERQIVYEIHDPAVARLVESVAQIAGPPRRPATSAPVARARTCYDAPGEVELGPKAETVFTSLGVDVSAARTERRRLLSACLDWTEREPHLGGALGAALWAEMTRVAGSLAARAPGPLS